MVRGSCVCVSQNEEQYIEKHHQIRQMDSSSQLIFGALEKTDM